MATVSLSKGVFAFNNSKLKRSLQDPADKLACFRKASEDNLGKIRYNHFTKCWQFISSKVERLLEESYGKVFDDLVDFIKKKGTESISSVKKDVPTACLVTGVNMPDHESLYSALKNSLQNNVTPHIVRLSSSDCPNIKSVIYKVVSTFMDGEEVVSFEDSDDDEEVESTQSIKRKNCNMPVLMAWYKDKYDIVSSPKKKVKKSKSLSESPTRESDDCNKPPLVIIVENMEGMPSKVIEDLVCLCSMYRSSLPLILILGVSTTPSAVHSSLRQDASACIAMETFQSLPSTELLSSIVENILLKSDVPFRLGGRSFKLLVDTFLFHDLSVKNFITGLKFLTLEHFLSSPGSFLCCSQEVRDELLISMPYCRLELLKRTPSYLSYYNTLDEVRKDYLKDANNFKAFVSDHLNVIDKKYADFCVLTRILHCLVYDLPGKPLGKRVREVMELCLIEQVTNSKPFGEAMNFLKISAKEEILPKVEEALKICREFEQSSLLEFSNKLYCLFVKLKAAGSEIVYSGEIVSPVRLTLKPTDRFNLREKLFEASRKNQTMGKSAYSLAREETLDLFKSWFSTHLCPPTEYLWHEVRTFNPPTSVFRFHLTGGLRAAITTGLSEPYKYLKCSCCIPNSSKELDESSSSDLTICYRLHLECGRHINLFDWMQAFIAVVGGVEDDDDIFTKETVDPKLQARFVQAVSELQLLGLIKPTKKKTDHVQRLTWGGC